MAKRFICSILFTLWCVHQHGGMYATAVVINNQNQLHSYLCGDLEVSNGTTLELDPGVTHVITQTSQSCVWANRWNIAIQSLDERVATVQCVTDSVSQDLTQGGIGFVEMVGFRLTNLMFENCGGVISNISADLFAPNQTSPRREIDSNQQAVVFLSRCTQVIIEDITFMNYRGYALYSLNMYGYNTLDGVTATDSFAYLNIDNVQSTDDRDLKNSGSGLRFHFSDKPHSPGFTNISINNCTLSNNFNKYPDYLVLDLQQTRLQNQPADFPLTAAGGLTVHFEQQKSKVVFNVKRTHFINNGGTAGGGAQVASINTVDMSDVVFTECTFVNNRISKYGGFFSGGGLQMFFVFTYMELTQVDSIDGNGNAKMEIENCEFRENFGVLGSAITIFMEAQNASEIDISIRSVRFINNEATMDGDCVLVESENSATYSERRPHIRLENIIVNHNGRNDEVDSSAALSFNNVFVTISGSTSNHSMISNGGNSGLKLFNAYAFLTGEVHFMNNTGMNGGAITMEANSYLLFKEPVNIMFMNNSAELGGAIYSDIVRGKQCVIQFISPDNQFVATNWTELDRLNFNISFVNNNATQDGHSIYAQPIYDCNWFSESVVQVPTRNVINVYQQLFHFQQNASWVNYTGEIRSHPYQPCFCNLSSDLECSKDLVNNISFSVPPGQPFIIPITPADQALQPLRSVVEVELLGDDRVRFFSNDRRQFVIELMGTVCYPLECILHNVENTNATIKLSIQGVSVSEQSITASVNIEDCPIGFQLDNSSGICDCIPLYESNNIDCLIKEIKFTKPKGYWIGLSSVNNGNVSALSNRCPSGFCQESTTVDQSFDNQCVGNRTGVTCGRCKEGTSMQFGSTDCKICSNYWLFTIILYCLAGILLVVSLFLLKLTITDGVLAPILFYAQLFSINLGLLVYSNETRFTTVFISLLNLELGFPLCFYDGMTQVGKYGLQFVFPVYLWLIVAVITIVSRFSSKVADLVGANCARVFVTLIYFSYTKLVRTSTDIFVFTNIITESDTKNSSYTVWFYDGEQMLFRGLHLFLGLISIFFLLFILTPYKFFTLLGQWCLHNSWVSRHFKPLIDATLAPYKDRWRFWFGVRLFVIDFMILIALIVSPFDGDTVTYAHLVILTLFVICQVHIKPYKSKLVHYLELFFLINYILFITGCLYIFEVVHPNRLQAKHAVTSVEVVIIGSAFIVFFFTVLYHIVNRVKSFYMKRGIHMAPKNKGGELQYVSDPNNAYSYSSGRGTLHSHTNVTLTVVGIDKSNQSYNIDDDRLRESLLEDY